MMIRRRFAAPVGALVALALVSSAGVASAQVPASIALREALDSIARRPVEGGRAASVALAVGHAGEAAFASHGRAALDPEVSASEETVYEIGSLTKQFTAAAVLVLADDGKVRLNEEISTYLPELPRHAGHATVRQLLDHTAAIHGMSFQNPRHQRFLVRSVPVDTMIEIFAAEPLEFETGTAMIYSNTGYFILGRIIEKVSGQSYGEFLRDRFFRPLGMARTGECATDPTSERAQGYRPDADGVLIPSEEWARSWGYAAGGLCSTSADLLTWIGALHGGRVLGPDAYGQMVTPDQLPDGHTLRYAAGLHVMEDATGHRVLRHGGALPGFLSEARYYPEADLAVVVLTNTYGPPGAEALADVVTRRLLGPAPRPAPSSYSGDLNALVGRYTGVGRNGPVTVTIERAGEELTARLQENGTPLPLRYLGSDTFAAGDTHLIFLRDAAGAVAVHLDEASGHYPLRPIP